MVMSLTVKSDIWHQEISLIHHLCRTILTIKQIISLLVFVSFGIMKSSHLLSISYGDFKHQFLVQAAILVIPLFFSNLTVFKSDFNWDVHGYSVLVTKHG